MPFSKILDPLPPMVSFLLDLMYWHNAKSNPLLAICNSRMISMGIITVDCSINTASQVIYCGVSSTAERR